MSETKILPCPFCGGEAAAGYAINDYNRWGVQCKDCGACVEEDEYNGTKEDAINLWNTRRPACDVDKVVEQVKDYRELVPTWALNEIVEIVKAGGKEK